MTGLAITFMVLWLLTLISFGVLVVGLATRPEPAPDEILRLLEGCDLKKGALIHRSERGLHAWYPVFGKNSRVDVIDGALFLDPAAHHLFPKGPRALPVTAGGEISVPVGVSVREGGDRGSCGNGGCQCR